LIVSEGLSHLTATAAASILAMAVDDVEEPFTLDKPLHVAEHKLKCAQRIELAEQCGVMMRFGVAHNEYVLGSGSGSKTSRIADISLRTSFLCRAS
jgi:hypothetical protein